MIKEIELRRSIRKYKDIPISQEALNGILEAGRFAPSGNNFQPWKFLVVTDKVLQQKIVAVDHNQLWMLTAPVFIVVLGDLSSIPGQESSRALIEDEANPALKRVIRDASIAITQMMLESVALGLGTCWTGWYQQADMRKALNIPDNLYVCGVLTLGYPDEEPAAKPRKPLSELVYYNTLD